MADLLSEAIADAKRVKSAAIANAKLTLEETFQPSIQRMISTKLAEEEGEDSDDDIDVNINFGSDDFDSEEDESIGMGSFSDEDAESEEEMPEEEPAEERDMELESLIRELEGEDFDDLEEGEEDNWSDPIPDAIHEEDMFDAMDEEELEEAIQRIVEEEMEDDMEDELSELFEADGKRFIIDGADEGYEDMDEEELEEAINEIMDDELEEDETIDLNIDEDDEFGMNERFLRNVGNRSKSLRAENVNLKNKLNEAYRAVTTMKTTLNEVNLLNAKLMYTTKTFKQFDLTESQQHSILDSFDRANSVREVKLIYTAICESRGKSKPKPNRITEGFASKPQKFINKTTNGTENRSNIVEGSVVRWSPSRLQQLAGLTKLED